MRTQSLTLIVALLLAPTCAAQDKGAEPAPLTPRQLAEKVLDDVRDAKHEMKMRIVWPPDDEEEIPASCELYMISGYLSWTCTRIAWDGRVVDATRVTVTSGSFHTPQGEQYRAEKLTVTPETFARAWRAAGLLLEATATEINPEPRDGRIGGSMSFTSGSGDASTWVRIREGGAGEPLYTHVVRGSSSHDGIRDFEEIRNVALYRLFDGILPEEKGRAPWAYGLREGEKRPLRMPTSPETLALLTSWAPRLLDEVKAATPGANAMKEYEALHLRMSLAMIGEVACEPAVPAIEALREKIAPALKMTREEWWQSVRGPGVLTRASQYDIQGVDDAAQYALLKIRLLHHWDADAAMKIVRDIPRKTWTDRDRINWIRARYFAVDPEGYRERLLADLADAAAGEAFLTETRDELAARYPGQPAGGGAPAPK